MAGDRKRGGTPLNGTPVGYGRPPEDHRFKTGDVGNPWGRKGKPKPKVDFLDEIVVLQIAGKSQRLTRDESVDFALYRAAITGNVSAAKELNKRQKERLVNRPETVTDQMLSPEDQAAFERLIARRARRSTATGIGPAAPNHADDANPSDGDEA